MNVLVFASRKGGSGKSTLAAHLASYIANPSRRTLLIDNDPQGSLSLWHRIRREEHLGLRHNVRNLAEAIKDAKREGYEWVLVDTPPNKSSVVADAISHRTELSLSLASGEGAMEYQPGYSGAEEMQRLWTALERSLNAINNSYKKSSRAA